MKCFEKQQFAYRARRGVEDATATLLNLILKHLEGSNTHAKILFVDFSSAFNTIQPHILVDKLLRNFNLDFSLVGWILDFLTDRTPVLSEEIRSSTGSPQGCVLSPLLYILYTDDCRSQHTNRHILKFADDSAIVSLLNGKESEHGPVLNDFIAWCDSAHLHLNVSKMKDMVIDYRRKSPPTQVTAINGQPVEVVGSYKYLGSIIDDRLNFNLNTENICKKGQQRLSCLRKLAKFNVDKTIMRIFYNIESVLSFSMLCWYGNLNVKDKASLTKIVKACGKIIGAKQSRLTDLYNRFVQKRLFYQQMAILFVLSFSCYLLSHVSDSLQLKPIDIDSYFFPVPFLY